MSLFTETLQKKIINDLMDFEELEDEFIEEINKAALSLQNSDSVEFRSAEFGSRFNLVKGKNSSFNLN
jgi:hypothetical protein